MEQRSRDNPIIIMVMATAIAIVLSVGMCKDLRAEESVVDNFIPSKWSTDSLYASMFCLSTINFTLTLDIVSMIDAEKEADTQTSGYVVNGQEYFYAPWLGRNPSYSDVYTYYGCLLGIEGLMYLGYKLGWIPDKVARPVALVLTALEVGSTLNTVWLEGKVRF